MPARTRTKRRSSLPPLKLSTLLASRYNLRPDEVNTVVCPSCETWQRIMGDKTRTIRDHYSTDLSGAELEAGQRDTRCPSARRIVEIDVKVAHWAKQVEEGSTQVAARRPTTVLRKVKTPTAPAITQLPLAQPTADTARRTYEAHRNRCAACVGKEHCRDGELLARRYLVRLEDEPRWQRVAATLQRERARFDRELTTEFPKRRAAEWRRVEEAVEAADARRAEPLKGARGPIFPLTMPKGTPTEPLKRRTRSAA